MKERLPEAIPLTSVDVWSQDEVRVGQQGSLSRIWAKRGTRPRKVKQKQFLSTYIYGAACHTSGASYGLVLPEAKSEAMNLFLEELSKCAEAGRHIALILDNAGWHKSKTLKIPDNITLIPLPPYSPELNAMEQIWEWLRNHHFSNQCYKNYEQIVDHACQAWKQISGDPALVRSIMNRSWVNLS